MPSEFTEANKAKIASSLSKIIEEDRDKFYVYHDIYHVLKTSCNCVVPSGEVLPEREDLLRFAQKKMHDQSPILVAIFFVILRILKNTKSIRRNWRAIPVVRNVVLETNR
jgi:hypothetical protein